MVSFGTSVPQGSQCPGRMAAVPLGGSGASRSVFLLFLWCWSWMSAALYHSARAVAFQIVCVLYSLMPPWRSSSDKGPRDFLHRQTSLVLCYAPSRVRFKHQLLWGALPARLWFPEHGIGTCVHPQLSSDVLWSFEETLMVTRTMLWPWSLPQPSTELGMSCRWCLPCPVTSSTYVAAVCC